MQQTNSQNPRQHQNGRNDKARINEQNDGLASYVFGKVQPQAVDLETAVIGALLLDKEAITSCIETLRPESFYVEKHQHIFQAVLSLFSKSEPVDLLTVTEELKKQGNLDKAGGGYYLVELTNRVASAANVEFHARIVAQKSLAREVISLSARAIQESYEETTDIIETLDKFEGDILALRSLKAKGDQDMAALMPRLITELQRRSETEGGLIGVPTGITSLDRKTGGWHNSDLIILAARPGMGKTSAILCFALNAAINFDYPIGLITLEMSAEQFGFRLLSIDSGIDGEKFRSGKLDPEDWQNLERSIQRLQSAPIYVDDTPAISILDLRAKARRWKQKYGIRALYVDYLQLMTTEKVGTREAEVSDISRRLKSLAKELDIPVIALSQLSRAVEIRGGSKRPQLSDLRESGSLEQDADLVGFIYRPEYYNILEDEQGQSLKGKAEIIIAKNRHGAIETVNLKYTAKNTTFSDLEEVPFSPGNIPSGRAANPEAFTEPANVVTNPARMNDEDIPF